MVQRIIVDSTSELRAAATAMDEVAAAVGDAVNTLIRTLSVAGDPFAVNDSGATAPEVVSGSSDNPPWGTDSYGKSFATGANGYVGMRTNLLQGGLDVARTLAEFAHGMHRAAGGLEATEEDSRAGFR